MKGVILAGGTGSRLKPLTTAFSKHLLPVFDKPLIHYPLGTLMLGGIRDFLVITTPDDAELFFRLMGDGSRWGISLNYSVQAEARGIADALLVAEGFVDGDGIGLILGDNIFHGPGLGLSLASQQVVDGGHLFAYQVADPRGFAVISFDSSGHVANIEEKPSDPSSNWIVPGLYYYSADAIEVAKSLVPSARGELEITDLNLKLLDAGRLRVTPLPRGTAWLDAGTFGDLLDAGTYVRMIEERQGLKVCCLEEIAWRQRWIDTSQLLAVSESMHSSPYGDYLRRLTENQNSPE